MANLILENNTKKLNKTTADRIRGPGALSGPRGLLIVREISGGRPLRVGFATRAAPGGVNGDYVAAGPDWALVLDGATACRSARSDLRCLLVGAEWDWTPDLW